MFKLMDEKIFTFLRFFFCLSKPMEGEKEERQRWRERERGEGKREGERRREREKMSSYATVWKYDNSWESLKYDNGLT